MKNPEFFEDTSIFQGIVEFSTPHHGKFRFERSSPGLWGVRRLERGAWVYQGSCRCDSDEPLDLARAWKIEP